MRPIPIWRAGLMRPMPIPRDQTPDDVLIKAVWLPEGLQSEDTTDGRMEVAVVYDANNDVIVAYSCWRPSPEDLVRLAAGEPVRLAVWGGQPPVAIAVGWADAWTTT